MEYNVTLQTIGWLAQQDRSHTLELSPKFQRRAVWRPRERSELLETIMLRLPFPEIYVQVVTEDETGLQRYVVVDGQQRCRSILMFVEGEVSLPSESDWQGGVFKDLSPEDKQAFWHYEIVVRMLARATDADIRELFARLNTNNFALNDQELRNARYTGEFKKVSERLADDPYFQDLGLFTAREVRRMEDIEFVSELLVRVVDGVQNKKDLLEDYYLNYDDEFPDQNRYGLEFSAALGLVRQVTTVQNRAYVKTKSNFYSLFGVCLQYYRRTSRTNFNHADNIAGRLTDLLGQARVFRSIDQEVADPQVAAYFDAVSRAASDKGQRVRREQLLLEVIKVCEPEVAEAL